MKDYGNRFLHILFLLIVIPWRSESGDPGTGRVPILELSPVCTFRFPVFPHLP